MTDNLWYKSAPELKIVSFSGQFKLSADYELVTKDDKISPRWR
jgi:hypothetical protein